MLSKEKLLSYDSPMDLPDMKKLIFALNLFGVWPHRELGGKQWFSDFRNPYAIFAFWSFMSTLAISYLLKNFTRISFFDLGHVIVTTFMIVIAAQRVTMAWTRKYKDTSRDFIQRMHLYHHKHENEYALKVYNEVTKITKILTVLLQYETIGGVILFGLVPVFNNYRNGMFSSNKPEDGTYEHALYFDFPFDFLRNLNGYLVVFSANWFLTLECASIITSLDLYLSVIVFHLWGHIKILKRNLEMFPSPELRGNSIGNTLMYSEDESENITELLIDSIAHHKLIKKFMDQVSMSFGATMCVYHVFHLVSGCILLMECFRMDATAICSYGILTFTVFQQLVQLSIVFEFITSQSETIKDAVYGVPWECMNTKNRKIVLFYLRNAQEPLAFKALGILPVGVKTMAKILKTSLSYFMLLRTVAEVED